MDKPFVSVNGVEIPYISSVHPQRFDITKGGRNPLTGKNRLRLTAKKWKLIIDCGFLTENKYQEIREVIDADSLNLTVYFKYGEEEITFNGYAVYTSKIVVGDEIGTLPNENCVGGRSEFNIELIEN